MSDWMVDSSYLDDWNCEVWPFCDLDEAELGRTNSREHTIQIVRDHNAAAKLREALGDCIEVIDGAINIPDPSDEDRECFRRVLVKAQAALEATEEPKNDA